MELEMAKAKIKELIDKYENANKLGRLKKYSEEETKKDFILPLFEILGWEVFEKSEVSAEESILSSGRVDYGFYLDGRAQFYLECKPFKVDINKEEYANQAVRYAWNKGVTWAVLTNFESIKVFNAQEIDKFLSDKLFFEIRCSEFLNRFDQLWLLSKEAFRENKLSKEAERVGKKLQKVSVSGLLYKDLNECRSILIHDLALWNKGVREELLDEGVQKILDRLIFLRVAEDRDIEPPTLIPLIRAWEASNSKEDLYASMVGKFRELDDVYNSNLFSPHPFEKWEEHGGATEKVINILYGKKGYYEYDFKVMPADILGSVYENYLGYRLSQSKKGLSIGKDAKKRKEQGIYYTPSYIVDYIVRNTLGPILDKCQSINDLKKIKVLDPACGSGSFLTKALEVIHEKYVQFGSRENLYTKITILLENIYGVDLDEQAVEIARLNLLINTLDQRFKFPLLTNNIKNGNSLISGSEEELKKYFGKTWKEKKAFNWEEEFPEVFRQGGFDCVIGNPPWGANIDAEAEFFAFKFPDSTQAYKDTYKIFIDRTLQIVKPEGYLGFVVPNTFLYQPRYQDIKHVIDQYNYTVINLGEKIFGNVELPCSLLIIQKKLGMQHAVVDLTKIDRVSLPSEVWKVTPETAAVTNAVSKSIIKNTGYTFDDVFLLKDAGVKHQRVNIGRNQKGKNDLRDRIYYNGRPTSRLDHPLLVGSDINRYDLHQAPTFILRGNYKDFLKDDEIVYFDPLMMETKEKILWRQTADKIRAIIALNYWFANTVQCAVLKDNYLSKIDLYFALSIFNSKYIDYLYRQKVLETGKVFPQVKLKYLRDLPFVIASQKQQEELAILSKKMIELNTHIREVGEGTAEWERLQSETAVTDRKIDEEVYKLYGLTSEEIKIVENS